MREEAGAAAAAARSTGTWRSTANAAGRAAEALACREAMSRPTVGVVPSTRSSVILPTIRRSGLRARQAGPLSHAIAGAARAAGHRHAAARAHLASSCTRYTARPKAEASSKSLSIAHS